MASPCAIAGAVTAGRPKCGTRHAATSQSNDKANGDDHAIGIQETTITPVVTPPTPPSATIQEALEAMAQKLAAQRGSMKTPGQEWP